MDRLGGWQVSFVPSLVLVLLASMADGAFASITMTEKAVIDDKLCGNESELPTRKTSNDATTQHTMTKTIYSSSSNQLPPVSTWEHDPIFVQAESPVVLSGRKPAKEGEAVSCPIGIPFEFESDLFKVNTIAFPFQKSTSYFSNLQMYIFM